TNGENGKETHQALPSCIAERTERISERKKLEASWKRSAFSARSRASRQNVTSLPSFLTWRPETLTVRGGPPAALRNSLWKSMSWVRYPGVSALAMLEATSF